MLQNIHPKYHIHVEPKVGTAYNYVHDEIEGEVATIIDLTVGKRGWLTYWCDGVFGCRWRNITTSTVEEVNVDDDGNIDFVTRNTRYFLIKIVN